MAATKCDIIRGAATASRCGMCTALRGAAPIPAGCGAVPPPVAACGVVGAANARMKLFATKLAPPFGDDAVREQTERIYEGIIEEAEVNLAAAYPGAAVDISWPDFEACTWNRSGEPGGFNNNVYFRREDVEELGMAPAYPIGGTYAKGAIWKTSSPVPVIVDYLMNPDLFAIVLFAFFVVVLAGLVWGAIRRGHSRERERPRERAVASKKR